MAILFKCPGILYLSVFSTCFTKMFLPFTLLLGRKQRRSVAQRQAAGLSLPGPHRQAVVPCWGGQPGPAGGVPGPPPGHLDRPFLSCRPGAGNIFSRRHHQTVGPARLQLPEGGHQQCLLSQNIILRHIIEWHYCYFFIFFLFFKTFEGHDASVLKVIFVSRGTQLLTR